MPLKNMKMKLARIERELTQEQLAEAVGVTRQTIGMIEAGKFNPSLQLCIAICRVLGKTLNDLFWEDQDETDEESRR
jgi:putative transcriptional regulator